MSEDLSQSDDDGVVRYAIGEALKAISKGDAELVELKLIISRPPPIEIKDGNVIVAGDEKYEDVPLTKYPRGLEAKLEIKVKQKQTGREVKAIAMPKPGKIGFNHIDIENVYVQDFGHLPNEADKDKKIKESNVDQILKWAVRVINILISIINAFFTWRSRVSSYSKFELGTSLTFCFKVFKKCCCLVQ